jgi:Domain amino terminal to FKBP-type peptidyl-prolyl isomerase.
MKQFLRPTLTAAAMAVALGMTAGAYAQAAKTTGAAATGTVDKAKASYVVGWEIASQVPPIMRDELDAAAVGRAVQAALSGQKPSMSEAEAKQVRRRVHGQDPGQVPSRNGPARYQEQG